MFQRIKFVMNEYALEDLLMKQVWVGREVRAIGVVDEQCPRCGQPFSEGCRLEAWAYDGQLVAVHLKCSPVAEAEKSMRPEDREAS